jgi:uncharacterized protein (DUF2141 family)
MKLSYLLYFIIILFVATVFTTTNSGCAQIGSITGGDKDSLPPKLLSASPKLLTTNFTGNRITFTFDEYIDELQEIQSKVMVSPYPKRFPELTSKLKTVSIKLKDTLLANTTYSINFGKVIKDVNEGNVLKDFVYVFSTGNVIDSLSLSGRVDLAETGKTDSSMVVMLYRNITDDSTVQKVKPNYIAFVKGDGTFSFNNLPADKFSVYALLDGDGGKTYNSKSELFAFADAPITVGQNNDSVRLFAYVQEKEIKRPTSSTVKPKTAAQKKLKYTLTSGQAQDITKDLVLDYSSTIKTFDSSKIILTDTNYVPVPGVSFLQDSNKIILKTKWMPEADYKLIIGRQAVRDSTDSTIVKTDTVRIKTKSEADYGNVVLRFNNIDLTKHPVIQFVQQDVVVMSYPLTAKEWRNKLFPPGEYDIRILYDDNNNGKWDPGNYSKKLQPEKVIALPRKFAVKENWDNESDIIL